MRWRDYCNLVVLSLLVWCILCLGAGAMQAPEQEAVTSAEEQEKWLADAMALVQHHAFYMHRALVSESLPISRCFFSLDVIY